MFEHGCYARRVRNVLLALALLVAPVVANAAKDPARANGDAAASTPAADATEAPPAKFVDANSAARFAALAMACVHKQYPNKISHVLNSDADVALPRELTPAFYGCYDWHLSVHGHWLLARLARTYPEAKFAPQARQALARSLTRRTSQRKRRTRRRPVAPVSSGLTASRGCCNSPRNCANGTTRWRAN